MEICTRPDIPFTVSVLSRKLHATSERHLILAKRVVRYIAGTVNMSIFYPKSTSNDDPLTAYTDADWAGCHDTHRPTTGLLITCNNAPIYWASKRQTLVTLSSGEAEYVAVSACCKEVIWIRRLFSELLHNQSISFEPRLPPTTMNTDSTSAISLNTKQKIS